ncbi:MAG: Uma2 family endonuclease [Saprospiraceae bacterium]|nr:Uma2 family endonuclease [Saprospiraceae bacterium]
MSALLKFPVTQQELFDVSKGELIRFPATTDEYWELMSVAAYRADYFDHEIIAAMSYETEDHSNLTTELSFILKKIFPKTNPHFKVHNSNRPLCIPGCDHAVFNPDGSVVAQPAQLYEYRPGMNAELTPVLLFEVLSKNTRSYDLGDKLPCYKKIPTLRQILYVDTQNIEVTVFERLEATGQWLETSLKSLDDQFLVDGQPVWLRDIYGIPTA